MRVVIVIALLVGMVFMILFVLADLARDLLRHSFQASPDLDSGDDWNVAADKFTDTAPPGVYCTEQQAVDRQPIGGMRGDDIAGEL